MTTLLICPGERSTVPVLSRHLPLAQVPVLGQTLLEYWLSALALQGAKDVRVLTHLGTDLAVELVGHGERWGLNAKVVNESRELTPSEALLKYAPELDQNATGDEIIVLDHFPGQSETQLFASYQHWFAGLQQWIPSAITPDRVGVNQTKPGIWMGCNSHVSPQAELSAPCWIGQHVFVGPHATIRPGTIIEDGCFIEPGAEVGQSWIGSDTFVGQFARIQNSLTWGSALVDWQTGSVTEIADRFLLCALRQPRRKRSLSWLRKLSDMYARNKGEVGMLWKQLLLHKES